MKLTEARDTERRDGVLWTHGMTRQAQSIFRGSLTMIRRDGCIIAGNDDEAGPFAGVAYETKQYITDAGNGDVREIRVFRQGCFLFDCDYDLSIEDPLGVDVFIVDDHTVSTSFHETGCGNHCGQLVAVETKRTCWIDIYKVC